MRSRHWNDEEEESAGIDCAAADLVFALTGRTLPPDYRLALSQAVIRVLPWLPSVPDAGLRLTLGAESGNGWQRPQGHGALIYLARRTRLKLRLPLERLAEARSLEHNALEVAGSMLDVGSSSVVALSPSDTLYARHVIDEAGDEGVFLDRVAQAIGALDIRRRKIMCGRERRIAAEGGELCTRSVLVAGLTPRESLTLMSRGIGSGRLLGCGLFAPYKRPDALARGGAG